MKFLFSCVLIIFLFSRCYVPYIVEIKELEYCKDFDNKLFIFKDKTPPYNDNISIYGGAFLPFTYSDTFDNEFFQLHMEFMEKTYYNHQIIVTTNGKKYSVLRLDKFESKINVNETKYLDFISERNIDTSNLILLDCTKNQ